MHLEGLGTAGGVLAPDLLEDVLTGGDLPAGAHQDPEQLELPGRQLQLARADEGPVSGDVDPDLPDAQLVLSGLPRGAADLCPHASQQLGQAEGLGDVVISPGVQTDDEVGVLTAGGEHEDRDGQALGPHLTGHVQAVDVRQPQVQDDDVSGRDLLEGAFTGAMSQDLVALTSKGSGEGFRDGRIVFDEQNSCHIRDVR